jgi:cellulase/cellobiase CelA1
MRHVLFPSVVWLGSLCLIASVAESAGAAEHVRWLDFAKLQTGDEGKIRYPVTVLTFVDSQSCVVMLKSPVTRNT